MFIAKICSINPETNTAEIFSAQFGFSPRRAKIICGVPYTREYGGQYYPSGVKESSITKAFFASSSDLVGVCDTISGQEYQFVVIGFLPPDENQLSIPEYGLEIKKHESGVISLTRANSETVFYHPSGSYVKFGDKEGDVVSTLKTTQTKDIGISDKSLFNNTNLYVRFHAGQSITLTKDGSIEVSSLNNACQIIIDKDGNVNIKAKKINITGV